MPGASLKQAVPEEWMCFEVRQCVFRRVRSWQHTPHRVSPQEAARNARTAFAEWRREVQARGRSAPGRRFHNLPPSELRRRLAALAKAQDFTIVRVEFLRPRELAPVVVVRT